MQVLSYLACHTLACTNFIGAEDVKAEAYPYEEVARAWRGTIKKTAQ